MRPSKAVLKATAAGRGVIPIGKMGRHWRAFRRPAHLCFAGEVVYELVAPTGEEWTYLLPTSGRPMCHPTGGTE